MCKINALQDLSLHGGHKTFTQSNDTLVTFYLNIAPEVNSFNTQNVYICC